MDRYANLALEQAEDWYSRGAAVEIRWITENEDRVIQVSVVTAWGDEIRLYPEGNRR